MNRLTAGTLLVLCACANTAEGPDDQAVASLSITPAAHELSQCRQLQLAARALNARGTELPLPTLTWSSSNPLIATVNATGLVTGVIYGGPVTIWAMNGRTSTSFSLTVYQRPDEFWEVGITPGNTSLSVGSTQQLDATEGANDVLFHYPVTWESMTPTIATVSSSGVVDARATGDALIRATFLEPTDGIDTSVCPARTFQGHTAVSVR
jgi:uncharacterized protein YjdB